MAFATSELRSFYMSQLQQLARLKSELKNAQASYLRRQKRDDPEIRKNKERQLVGLKREMEELMREHAKECTINLAQRIESLKRSINRVEVAIQNLEVQEDPFRMETMDVIDNAIKGLDTVMSKIRKEMDI